mgnify:CR=1 FL=1
MQKVVAVFSVLLMFCAVRAGAGDAALRIEITGLAGTEGTVFISVYDNEDAWLGEDTVITEKIEIASARVEDLVVADIVLPPGQYAVSLFYDANANGKLDSNFIGIPKEPVALSNNAKPKFGPPKYKDAVFALGAEGLTQRIAIESI